MECTLEGTGSTPASGPSIETISGAQKLNCYLERSENFTK